MGIELVEGQDLVVLDGALNMKTTQGLKRVDVLYRRIDDDFLDPLVFRPESMLGVPGIFDTYRAGRVTLVNAPGAGIADDKAIYSYIPEIIEFYSGSPPIIPNVETFNCRKPDDLKYVLENLEQLVVKEVHGSGGYGMLIGPTSSAAEIEKFPRQAQGEARNVHRAADARALDLPDLRRGRALASSSRPASLRPRRRPRPSRARRPDARCAEEGLARRQLEPGWRHQGHMGSQGLIGF